MSIVIGSSLLMFAMVCLLVMTCKEGKNVAYDEIRRKFEYDIELSESLPKVPKVLKMTTLDRFYKRISRNASYWNEREKAIHSSWIELLTHYRYQAKLNKTEWEKDFIGNAKNVNEL